MKFMRTFFYLDKFVKEFAKTEDLVVDISRLKTYIRLRYLDDIFLQIIFDYAYVQIDFSISKEKLTKCFYEKCLGFTDFYENKCGNPYGSWKIFTAKFSYDDINISDVLDQRFAANRYLAVHGISRMLKKKDLALTHFSFYTGSLNPVTKNEYNFTWEVMSEEKSSNYLKSEDYFINNYLVKMINPMWLKYAKAL